MPEWGRLQHFKCLLTCRLTGSAGGNRCCLAASLRSEAMAEVKSAPTLKSYSPLKSSPSTQSSSRGAGGKKFSSTSDYKQTLNRLKVDFERRYQNPRVASETGLDDYDVLRTLGTGAFGVVRLIRKKKSEEYFAMKIVSKERIIRQKQQLQHMLNEKRILQSVEFPFLVTMESCYKDNSFIYLAMPFVSGGELYSLLRKNKRFGEDQTKFYGAQVALAVEYLHHLGLIYRDLKPENILIDAKGYVKITDFGFCKLIRDRTWTLCGTPEYLAPEIIQNKGYGKSVDWWSFGVLLYEMIAGYSPFYTHSADQMLLFEKIVKGKVRFPSNFGTDIRNLIQSLVQVDLTKRFGNLKNGTSDIKQHAWFRGTNWIGLLNGEVTAPFIPKVAGPGDTSQFDAYEEPPELMVTSKCLYVKEFADF
ncbi:cAMP-dependent protein kinase catalytic subunit beta isoform X1 [Culex quinquefasciatus]|uniref:cAMP-dependent protein kinase catalytic subunit beta isoform X1 n=1 Tax=Culex quinquefasciatus TaxID=7176 RepID=UPI0018E29E87|nr:cAMP-dependent protein kinase catalytic subunit beta isoform X1 [Culex quinquefasciatus]